jgi:hypothetical protein
MGVGMIRLCSLLSLLVLLVGCGASSPPAPSPESPATTLREFTGAPARVVWMRQVDLAKGYDPFGYGAHFALYGYDSEDGRGAREILPGPLSCRKPLLTADGQRVVYTDMLAKRIFVVPFAGGTPVPLGEGMACEVWRDPAGVEWVYFSPDFRANSTRDGLKLMRLRLDAPGQVELVWDDTPVTPDNFQLTADGRFAAGLFPWSAAGLLNLEKRLYRRVGTGCWAAMAPDNSYRMWIFDGAHVNVLMRDFQSATPTPIRINRHPALAKGPVYHPRWSNHVRFLTLTGPYQGGQNGIDRGGAGIDVYLGRFHAEGNEVEAMFELTNDDPADFFPDLWVAGGEATGQREPPGARSEAASAAPADLAAFQRHLRLRWINARENDWRDEASGATRVFNFNARGQAVPGRHHDMVIRGGGFDAAFDTTPLLEAVRASGAFTLELVLNSAGRGPDPAGIPWLWGENYADANLALGEYNGTWYLRLRTDTREPTPKQDIQIAGATADGRPRHLLIAYESGRLAVWLDGVLQTEFADVTGGLAAWKPGRITLGSEANGQHRWAGRIEGVRLFDRAAAGPEAAALWADARTRLADRTAPPRAVVRARLVESGFGSTPESIRPYRRSLYDAVYRVLTVESGDLVAAGTEILVADWAILDAVVRPDLPQVGSERPLVLERREDHPELEGERLDPIDRFELPAFVVPFE